MEENKTIRESANNLSIEGIINSIERKDSCYNGKDKMTLNIEVKLSEDSYVTLTMKQNKLKANGQENSLYKGMETIAKFPTIATHGEAGAERIRVNKGDLAENAYISERTEKEVSFPIFRGTFIDRLKAGEVLVPKANGVGEFVILGMRDEFEKDQPTGRIEVAVANFNFQGNIQRFKMVVPKDKAPMFKAIYSQAIGATCNLAYNIANKTEFVEGKTITMDFGDSFQEEGFTKTVTELVITGGQKPLTTGFYTEEEVKSALQAREAYLKEGLERKKNKGNNNTSGGFDTGFGGDSGFGGGFGGAIGEEDIPF